MSELTKREKHNEYMRKYRKTEKAKKYHCEYMQKWSTLNKEKALDISRKYQKNNKEKISSYKLKKKIEFNNKWRKPCYFCNNTKTNMGIAWHHVDSTTKHFEINYPTCLGKSDQMIQEEINKCIPLCSSCHQKIHLQIIKMKKINQLIWKEEKERGK